jgi:predicted dehydrogenase
MRSADSVVAPVRIGLAGFGFGGRYFHAPLLAAATGCDFIGVVTRSPERRAAVAEALPGRATFDSLAQLAAAGAEAVAISTPANSHIALVLEALELGLAVVCDRPFALDAASARRAVDEAARRALPLTVYQNRRWDSDFLTVTDLVRTDAMGQVLRFESAFERFAPEPGPPAAGGGTLLDFGSHLVDQALHLFGAADRVYAELNHRADNGRDDDMFVALSHRSGVRSHLRGSWTQGAPAPRFRVTGASGSYVVDGMDAQEDQLLSGATPATLGAAWGAERTDRGSVIRQGDTSLPVGLRRGRWDSFYPAFAAAVRGRGPVPVDPGDAVQTAVVLDAAGVSARTGQAVRIAEAAQGSVRA